MAPRFAEIEFAATDDRGKDVSEFLTFGDLIQQARSEAGIKLRELARRSEVSPGQISRIESGQVARPSEGTLRGLARALGRSDVPLRYLVGLIDEADLREHATRILGDSDGSLALHEGIADAVDFGSPELLCGRLWRLDTLGVEAQLNDLDSEEGRQLREVVFAWPAISETRRRLVLAFVDDQVALSTAERMSAHAGKYELSIELVERDDA